MPKQTPPPNPDQPTPSDAAEPAALDRPRLQPIDWLAGNPFQPRLRSFDHDDGLAALVEDMQRSGFKESLPARRNPQNPHGTFQIVYGHRRLEAARRAGLTKIPIQIVDYTDDQMRLTAIRENLLRQDLTPWEEAVFMQGLRDDGMTYNDVATYVAKSKGWVQSRLHLLKLAGPLREAAQQHPDMLTVLNTLLLLAPADREALFAQVRAGTLNVTGLRALVRAQRERLRRLEEEILPEGGRRIAVSLAQQQAIAGEPTDEPRPAEPGLHGSAAPRRRARSSRKLRIVWDGIAVASGDRSLAQGDQATAVPAEHDQAINGLMAEADRLRWVLGRVHWELATPEERFAWRTRLEDYLRIIEPLT